MQKNTPVVRSGDVQQQQQKMQPSVATIQKIMQFASSYRPQKLSDDHYVDLILN